MLDMTRATAIGSDDLFHRTLANACLFVSTAQYIKANNAYNREVFKIEWLWHEHVNCYNIKLESLHLHEFNLHS